MQSSSSSSNSRGVIFLLNDLPPLPVPRVPRVPPAVPRVPQVPRAVPRVPPAVPRVPQVPPAQVPRVPPAVPRVPQVPPAVPRVPPVLSIDFDLFEDDADTGDAEVPHSPRARRENVAATQLLVPTHHAATHIWPLKQILLSGLCATGFIRAIYVNFGPMGYYKLNPNEWPITQPAEFDEQLRKLHQNGTISNRVTGEVASQNLTNFSSVVSALPENCIKIGCMHGAGSISQLFMNFRDYIRAASDEQVYVFVVGPINTLMHEYIDDFVKVSDNALVTSQCLREVISEMEIKWNIS